MNKREARIQALALAQMALAREQEWVFANTQNSDNARKVAEALGGIYERLGLQRVKLQQV